MKKAIIAAVLVLAVGGGMLFAQAERTPVKLPATVKCGYGKRITYTVTAPNTLAAVGKGGQDISQVNLRDLAYNGAANLVIVIKAMDGKFPWDDGKMLGVTIGGKSVVPEGKKFSDKMIWGPHTVGEEMKFPIPAELAGKTAPITIVLLTYAGANYTLEFWWE